LLSGQLQISAANKKFVAADFGGLRPINHRKKRRWTRLLKDAEDLRNISLTHWCENFPHASTGNAENRILVVSEQWSVLENLA